jgi:predicted secreted protein
MFEYLPVSLTTLFLSQWYTIRHTILPLCYRTFLANFTLETEFEPFYQKQLHVIHRSAPFIHISL